MKTQFSVMLTTAIILCACSMTEIDGQSDFRIVDFPTEDDGHIEAALFEKSKEKVVLYAHGAVFNKESWYPLATKFASEGYSSLSIDFRGYGNSKAPNTSEKYRDILGAIEYLEQNGYTQIYIIGGSMGGAAVLEALNKKDQPNLSKTILMAPAGGPPMQSSSYGKLIIVSKNEGLYSRVKTIYEESADPKIFEEYSGSAHAQHMFKEDYAEDLTQLIIDFVKQ